MKKKLFKLLPVLLLGLTACGGGKSSSSGDGGSSATPTSKDAIVIFYLDCNHADEENPYFKAEWYFGVPIDREQLLDEDGNKLVDPKDSDASYEEFGHFLGWSIHPVIDDEKDLWDFSKDVSAQTQLQRRSDGRVGGLYPRTWCHIAYHLAQKR